jgi:hypothetical protein
VGRKVEHVFRGQFFKCMAHDFPVHKVLGMKNGQPWNALERGSRQVIVFARCTYTHVRIAIVGIDNRILICSITKIWTPHFRAILGMGQQGKYGKQ